MSAASAGSASAPLPLTAQLWEHLVPLHSTVATHLERSVRARHGLSLATGMALGAVVAAGPQGVRAGTIAQQRGLTPASISRAVVQLERSRLVTRLQDAQDRRLHIVRATAEGITCWTALSETIDKEMHHVFTAPAFTREHGRMAARLCNS